MADWSAIKHKPDGTPLAGIGTFETFEGAAKLARSTGCCHVVAMYRCGCTYDVFAKPSGKLARDPFFLPKRRAGTLLKRKNGCVVHPKTDRPTHTGTGTMMFTVGERVFVIAGSKSTVNPSAWVRSVKSQRHASPPKGSVPGVVIHHLRWRHVLVVVEGEYRPRWFASSQLAKVKKPHAKKHPDMISGGLNTNDALG